MGLTCRLEDSVEMVWESKSVEVLFSWLWEQCWDVRVDDTGRPVVLKCEQALESPGGLGSILVVQFRSYGI